MSKEDVRRVIVEYCNHLSFEYKGQKCGVTIFFSKNEKVYQAWNGNNTRLYIDEVDVMSDKFFDGKSLNELTGEVMFLYA